MVVRSNVPCFHLLIISILRLNLVELDLLLKEVLVQLQSHPLIRIKALSLKVSLYLTVDRILLNIRLEVCVYGIVLVFTVVDGYPTVVRHPDKIAANSLIAVKCDLISFMYLWG